MLYTFFSVSRWQDQDPAVHRVGCAGRSEPHPHRGRGRPRVHVHQVGRSVGGGVIVYILAFPYMSTVFLAVYINKWPNNQHNQLMFLKINEFFFRAKKGPKTGKKGKKDAEDPWPGHAMTGYQVSERFYPTTLEIILI